MKTPEGVQVYSGLLPGEGSQRIGCTPSWMQECGCGGDQRKPIIIHYDGP